MNRGGRLAAGLLGAALLGGCATEAADGAPFAVPVRAESTADFRLTRPSVTLQAETSHLRGALCRRWNSDAWSPRRLLVTGYDAAHHEVFRTQIGIAPLLSRSDDSCHNFAANLPATPAPSEIEVRAIPYGEDAPP